MLKTEKEFPKLSANSLVKFNDKQTMLLHKEKTGKLESEVYYKVNRVWTITEPNNFIKYTLVQLEEDGLYVVLVTDPENGEWLAGRFFAPKEVIHSNLTGNRQDFLDAGNLWLFQAPPDDRAWTANELKLTTTLPGSDAEFVQVIDPIRGHIIQPHESRHLPCLLARWKANQEVENPEVCYIEFGSALDSPTGGVVLFLQGVTLQDGEMEIL